MRESNNTPLRRLDDAQSVWEDVMDIRREFQYGGVSRFRVDLLCSSYVHHQRRGCRYFRPKANNLGNCIGARVGGDPYCRFTIMME